jgi:hypothetical protein
MFGQISALPMLLFASADQVYLKVAPKTARTGDQTLSAQQASCHHVSLLRVAGDSRRRQNPDIVEERGLL